MGFMSVPLGIGAGSLGVPFIKVLGYSINIAIGTSATIGIVNSVCGAITMAISGTFFSNVQVPFQCWICQYTWVYYFCTCNDAIGSNRSKNRSFN